MAKKDPSSSSSQTLDHAHYTTPNGSGLFAPLPPLRVSSTHLDEIALGAIEDQLSHNGATLTWDANEAIIVLTRVERKRRAQFDLRTGGVETEEVPLPDDSKVENAVVEDIGSVFERQQANGSQSRSRLDDDSTQTESQQSIGTFGDRGDTDSILLNPVLKYLKTPTIKVIRMRWVEECLQMQAIVPVAQYVIFEGVKTTSSAKDAAEAPRTPTKRKRELSDMDELQSSQSPGQAILARAKAEAMDTSPKRERDYGSRRFGDKSQHIATTAAWSAGAHSSQKQLPLLHETTSEYEGDVPDSELPPPPEWITKGLIYACQRPTPPTSLNDPFIDLLKEIRLARLLTDDQIGVRAYSTSIAALAAYPYKLASPKEVLRLPGCDVKIANLFVEYANTGMLNAAQSAKDDPDLKILRLFFDIWGVGATTARDFYYQRGWKELDDVVEFGWSTLSRVQQIGVKYYDEFKDGIPRQEVEDIAAIVHKHAVKVRDSRIQSLLVGGHRRGKTESGDVDLIVSHPDESATKNLVTDIVTSLEDEGWITHTLLLALTSTHRDQQTLPFRASKTQAGSGFDTLDKALVVWQDPSWESEVTDERRARGEKNPAPHRRVDIIISPWRTVGCAVMGWSGGTTFQRDVRRYAKNVKGWKFDSSGVRDRGSGRVVDVEGYFAKGGGGNADEGRGVIEMGMWKTRAKTMVEAEKRVFDALGLEWPYPTTTSSSLANPVQAPPHVHPLLSRLHALSLSQESTIDPAVYTTARSPRLINATNIVEAGTSYGVSTIYLVLAVGQNVAGGEGGKERGR
ncbi:DNA polymerase type-X-like protein [Elsinoe fawcettii]|nr:DNA polymerase type-X-like protein [Elsinoe fawcettii]